MIMDDYIIVYTYDYHCHFAFLYFYMKYFIKKETTQNKTKN